MDDKKWWTRTPSEAWHLAKVKVMAAWDRLVGTRARLQKAVAEKAVEFGREARGVYADMGDWTDTVEDRLRTDWRAAGRDAEHAWDTVREAVRHGWDSAAETVTAAAETAAAAVETAAPKRRSRSTGKGAKKAGTAPMASGPERPEGEKKSARSLGTPARTGRASTKAASAKAKGQPGRKPRVSGARGATGAKTSGPGPKASAKPKAEPSEPEMRVDAPVRPEGGEGKRPVTVSRGNGAVRRHSTAS